MSDYLGRWLEDPDGGGRFVRQRDAILAHGLECPGLKHAWLPRKGGVTCLTDIADCHGCGVTLFWEGVAEYETEACEFSEHAYCACCVTKDCGCTE